MNPQDLFLRLKGQHDTLQSRLRQLDAYYEGEQALSYMHPELVQTLEGQVRQVVVNWPQMIVDALEERLDIEGFRRPDSVSGDDEIWQIWQANDMDAWSQRAHVDALVMGWSYAVVGASDSPDDPPLITEESAMDVYATTDTRTGAVTAAIRQWNSDPYAPEKAPPDQGTLYLPDSTLTFSRESGAWELIGTDTHNLGVVPVVPIQNRMRRKKPLGVSELNLVLPLSDAACKIATDMMVGSNFHALPRYFATGISQQDFADEAGNPISVWKSVTGRIFATEENEAKIGTLAQSDLSNFHNTLKALSMLVASLTGMPPHYLGFATDNPASAEGIKSSESRLVKRVERKQGMFDVSWEQVVRLAMRIQTGSWDPALRLLETEWRDPATPTIGQTADATVKLYQAGIIPKRFARRKLRYNDAEIQQMEAMDAAAAAAAGLPAGVEDLELRDQPGKLGAADLIPGQSAPAPAPVPA